MSPVSNPKPFLLDLDEFERASLALCGGKGFRLAAMKSWGLSVPGGFCITSAFFENFAEANGLDLALPEGFPEFSADQDTHLAETYRNKILSAPYPPPLEALLQEQCRAFLHTLPDGSLVAVRSSATHEDSEQASFAGIQESYLGLQTCEQIFEAVKQCLVSAFTVKAFAYRRHKNIFEPISMAVVVQRQVRAEKSGVIFSTHPVTGNKKICVINASWGLGEALVSGKTTPDHYELDRYLCALLKFSPGDFSHDLKQKKGKRVLSNEELDDLFNLVLEIENHLDDQPQDVE